MILGSDPMWVYEEDDINFNASPGVVNFGNKDHGLMAYVIPIVLFLLGSIIFAGFVENVLIYNYEKMMDEDGDEPCWPEWEDRIVLTNGTYMCKTDWNTYREGYSNYMTSDNHYKFKEYGETYEHRWSEQDGYLFISWIPSDRDHYECYVYIRESNLPENLTGDEFWYFYHNAPNFPDWCDEDPRTVDRQYSSNSSAPFNGERIYKVHESQGELYGIDFEQFTDDERIISGYYYIDENPGDYIVTYFPAVLGLGLMSVPIFFGRKVEYIIDIKNSVFSKQFVSYPHLAKRKKLAEPFEMYLISTTKEIIHTHQDGGSHTSYASGMEFSIAGDDGDLINVIFFRSGDTKRQFKQTLEKIEFVTGKTFENSSNET